MRLQQTVKGICVCAVQYCQKISLAFSCAVLIIHLTSVTTGIVAHLHLSHHS